MSGAERAPTYPSAKAVAEDKLKSAREALIGGRIAFLIGAACVVTDIYNAHNGSVSHHPLWEWTFGAVGAGLTAAGGIEAVVGGMRVASLEGAIAAQDLANAAAQDAQAKQMAPPQLPDKQLDS